MSTQLAEGEEEEEEEGEVEEEGRSGGERWRNNRILAQSTER